MARWIAEEGLALDVRSAGELAVARSVRFPAERILIHNNGKTPEDLRAALSYGVSRIVVDCPSEITRLAALAGRDRPPAGWRACSRPYGTNTAWCCPTSIWAAASPCRICRANTASTRASWPNP